MKPRRWPGLIRFSYVIDHAKDERLLNVLRHLQTEAGSETRKTPESCCERSGNRAWPGYVGHVPLRNVLGLCLRSVCHTGDWCREGGKVHGCGRANQHCFVRVVLCCLPDVPPLSEPMPALRKNSQQSSDPGCTVDPTFVRKGKMLVAVLFSTERSV